MTGPDWTGFPFCSLSVQDNGIGFEPECAERIFIVFQRLYGRTQFEGTGLSLAVCKKIAGNHHGAIRISGKPGEGALFEVVLPVQQAPFVQALKAANLVPGGGWAV